MKGNRFCCFNESIGEAKISGRQFLPSTKYCRKATDGKFKLINKNN